MNTDRSALSLRKCGQDEYASLHAIGLLEQPELAAFTQHLPTCRSCQEEFAHSGELASALASASPLQTPPPELRQRVRNAATLPAGVAALVRGFQLNWQPTGFHGVFSVRLYEDSVRREIASLVRAEPGACHPAHHHSGVEHCYVLQGDLVFHDHELRAGDYEAARGGADHYMVTSRTGCLLFPINHMEDHVHAR